MVSTGKKGKSFIFENFQNNCMGGLNAPSPVPLPTHSNNNNIKIDYSEHYRYVGSRDVSAQ